MVKTNKIRMEIVVLLGVTYQAKFLNISRIDVNFRIRKTSAILKNRGAILIH